MSDRYVDYLKAYAATLRGQDLTVDANAGAEQCIALALGVEDATTFRACAAEAVPTDGDEDDGNLGIRARWVLLREVARFNLAEPPDDDDDAAPDSDVEPPSSSDTRG